MLDDSPTHEPALTDDELISTAREFARNREHLAELMVAVMEQLTGIANYLQAYAKAADTRDELLGARMTLHTTVVDLLGSLKDVIAENTVALNSNTDRLEKFLAKFEMYFGTERGLELEN